MPKKKGMLEESLFPVIEEPAIMGKGFNYNDKTGHKFIIREDTGKVLSCMTNEYKLVTNEDCLLYTSPSPRD